MGYKKPPTKNPGSTLTAQEWNTYIRANMEQAWNVGNKYDYAQIVPYSGPIVPPDPALSVAPGTTADIPWEDVTYPLGGGTPANYFDSTLNAMVVPEPGVYQVTCSFSQWSVSVAQSQAAIQIVQYRSASVVRYAEHKYDYTTATSIRAQDEVTGMFTARAGDYFRVTVFNLSASGYVWFDDETYFEMRYMGDYGVD